MALVFMMVSKKEVEDRQHRRYAYVSVIVVRSYFYNKQHRLFNDLSRRCEPVRWKCGAWKRQI
jgi:hypothetical protein